MIRDFRKLKIVFTKQDGKKLSLNEVESLLSSVFDIKEKWFLRGVKHILENHYTEAIKRFQLVDDPDANSIILACAYKIQDKYIFDSYKSKALSGGSLFEKFGFYPYFMYEDKTEEISKLLKDEGLIEKS
ncbi:MAG: hypothetical protein ABWJ98_06850 [Hydrogenothermaceae bacterium]